MYESVRGLMHETFKNSTAQKTKFSIEDFFCKWKWKTLSFVQCGLNYQISPFAATETYFPLTFKMLSKSYRPNFIFQKTWGKQLNGYYNRNCQKHLHSNPRTL